MSKSKKKQRIESTTVGVVVSHEEYNLMRRAAERDGRSLSAWCRRMIFIGLNTDNRVQNGNAR